MDLTRNILLEAMKLIYNLLESKSEFDMLVLLILSGENRFATLVFLAKHSSGYQLRTFTVYGE